MLKKCGKKERVSEILLLSHRVLHLHYFKGIKWEYNLKIADFALKYYSLQGQNNGIKYLTLELVVR